MQGIDRTGTGSSKWARAGDGRIALGLADMDLPGLPEIGAALAERARHSAYGYTVCDPGGRALVAGWYRERHGVLVDPEWVLLLPFGPRTALRLLLSVVGPRWPVLFPTPEWGGFEQLCRAAGLPYRAVGLARDADGYRLPVGAFAGADLVLLSSPHNPSGRVWTRDEIRGLAEGVAEAGGLLVSDEVHSDLAHPHPTLRHPVAVSVAGELARHTVTLNSVGKTFNTSGIPSCFALVPDPGLRERLTTRMAEYGLWEGGLLEQVVQRAALRHGGPWLDALLDRLAANRELVLGALPGAVLSRPEASYLVWLDAVALGLPAVGAREILLAQRDVELSAGTDCGAEWTGCLRLNYALPESSLRTALTRLTRC
ncbi:aminotransferase class I/II-fold pyridoxal phosphate-dependent enzyme [Kitasatospora sp. MAP5-34]|uniref:aminotransferase class I/II-fold pyridoxal phosphate-dependent enzyme n=1 Tax=Kitasatospora sp. MAP5-34 TaxID=3035102 RepID=UPI002473CE25|nr:aminotransferase class I/II-fold pyridoxal phosphate-dependent enzyme [Kitasatospora sp. MAP5-34]MDH6575141.1 cystathionine beta-lyase [Kitasatospora sp. MAP5-34]